ncbi:MAG: hypothetical protein QXN68_02715 [Thermoplasmata archaeon]
MNKGYINFNFKSDVILSGKSASYNKIKKYTLEQQKKQCDLAIKKLQKQELKGLIVDLDFTYTDDSCMITYKIPKVIK